MRNSFLLPALLSTALAANAEEPIAKVEITGAPAQQQRRDDMAGRIVVGRDELARYGDSSLADALRRQPGITVSGGEVQLRGLGGGRTQLLLNGEPAPPGFSPDSLPPQLIERIEILRSANADSSAQGIAGSINIVLRKAAPRSPTVARLAGTHGSAGWWPDASLDLAWPGEGYSGSLAAQANRSRRTGGSTIVERSASGERSTAETSQAASERLALAPRLNWKSANGDTLAWQNLLDLVRNQNQASDRETAEWGETSKYPLNGFRFNAHTVTARSDANASQRLGDNTRLEWKAGLAHNRRDSRYLFTGSDANSTPQWLRLVLSNAIDQSGNSTGKLRVASASGHALALGWDATLARRSEWRRQEDSSAAGMPLGDLDQRYTARVQRLAAYAQDEWSPLPQLDAYLGLRWEGLRTRTDGRNVEEVGNSSGVWSPIGHLLWRLADKRGQVRLSLARSYKAPATRDLVPRRYTVNNANGPANPHFQGNPALRPELAWGLDLAYEKYFSGGSMFSASAYQRRISDVIQPFLFTDAGEWVSTPRNAGRAVAKGLELESRAALGPGSTARLTLSRNWSRVDEVPGPANRLGEQTPLALNAGMDHRLGAGLDMGFNWNVTKGGTVRMSESLWRERGTERRLDLHGSWQVRPGLKLRVSAANLLAPASYEAQRFDDNVESSWRSTTSKGERKISLSAEFTL